MLEFVVYAGIVWLFCRAFVCDNRRWKQWRLNRSDNSDQSRV